MRKKLFILGLLASAVGQILAHATSSVSAASLPQGMVVIAAGAVGSTTYLSLPLSSNATYAGVVGGVSASTISVTGGTSPFTINLASASAPYFVKMLSGSETGRMLLITGNTTTSVTVSTTDNTTQQVSLLTSGFAVSTGDAFEVVPGDTLSSIFGANTAGNPLSLTGGSSYTSADWVNIYNPSTGSWQIYFFDTALGYWTLEGTTTNANTTVLYPYSGLSITRHAASEPTSSLILTGRVPEVSVLTKTTGSNSIVYVSSGYPVGMTLSQLNLGPNWIKGSTTATADVVSVWNSATKTFVSYYQMTDSTWRQSGNTTTDQSSTVLPPGGCLALLQHMSVSGSTSYLPSIIPYSVPNL